jgi:hypothetical protein
MRDSRKSKVESRKLNGNTVRPESFAFDSELSTFDRVGVADRRRRRFRWGVALVLGAALVLAGSASAQYIAVFVDGRILAVTGARAIDGSRFRLDLPGGGSLEVPLSRIDRVIADEVEPEPKPIPPAFCGADYVEHPFGPGVPFAREIMAAARAAKIHPLLVLAVVRAESDFKPWAVSRVGACGLMQLMPSVWLEQGLADPYDPGANLKAGCRHLRALLDRFKEVPTARAAYNAGVATVEKSGGMPPYRETREFVRRVLGEFCPNADARPGRGAE